MNLDEKTSRQIQELQSLEQQLQNFLMQRQSTQVELNEILNALEEVRKSKEEIYKIVSGVMIRAEKDATIKELEEKKRIFELRISSTEKQEKILEEKSSQLRKEINDAVSEKTKEKKD